MSAQVCFETLGSEAPREIARNPGLELANAFSVIHFGFQRYSSSEESFQGSFEFCAKLRFGLTLWDKCRVGTDSSCLTTIPSNHKPYLLFRNPLGQKPGHSALRIFVNLPNNRMAR